MSDIEEIDGKLFKVRILTSGAIIRSEVRPALLEEPQESLELQLLKKIADKLGVTY